jgi:hypothetical protein
MGFMDPNVQQGLNMIKGRSGKSGNKKLPYHSRPKTLAIAQTKAQKGCTHSLSRYDDVTTSAGKVFTLRYAMPCVVGHKKTTKSPTHKDLAGRKWQ